MEAYQQYLAAGDESRTRTALDQYRYIIQKDVDIPVLPDPGDAVLYRAVFRTPKIVCTTSDQDLDLIGGMEYCRPA